MSAPAWTRADFAALRERVATALVPTTLDVVGRVEKVLAAWNDVQVALPDTPPPAQADAIADVRAQLGQAAARRLRHRHRGRAPRRSHPLPHRHRQAARPPGRRVSNADRDRMLRVHAVQQAYDDLVATLSPGRAAAEDVRDIARMIEELRVSLWAQQLGTARPVSEQRIYRAIDAIQP